MCIIASKKMFSNHSQTTLSNWSLQLPRQQLSTFSRTMASSFLILLTLLAVVSSSPAIGKSDSGCFESIVSFGDSLADTGNDIVVCQAPAAARPPYGRTYFHRPTGRCSDGRLVVDFVAQSLGLPFVEPYMKGGGAGGRRFSGGVNFAVAGASALDFDYYENMGIHNSQTNVSLGTQLDWLRQFLSTIPDGREFLEKSLVLMGEIGGNDYNHPIMQGISFQEIQAFVPPVITYIGHTIQELIELGAKTLVVPGNLPIGCLPIYLTEFESSSAPEDYDPKTGCLIWLNEFSMYHNQLLNEELNRLRELYPHVVIIYADYYNAAFRFYVNPKEFGFGGEILRACCGSGGGAYNYDPEATCGTSPAVSCDDPSVYASWDGMHMTEAAYKLIAQALLQGSFTTPQFATTCPSKTRADS